MPDTINGALLIVRIGLGIVFLAHGVKHARGRAKTSKWFASIGFKSPDLQWLASTATEISVGALLIVGLLTGFAAAGVIGIMSVAYWTVHRTAGFFITSFMKEGVEVEGYEYVAALGMIALALAISGPGEFSVDHAIELSGVTLAEYLDGRAGALLAIGAVAVSALQLATFWRPEVTD